MTEPQLSAEMEKRFDEELCSDGELCLPEDGNPSAVKHFLATALEEEREKVLEEVDKKDKTIENLMEEIRYLRSSQPERRKPVIRIRVGDDWHIPMITQAHDTPDGLYIEAELNQLKEGE